MVRNRITVAQIVSGLDLGGGVQWIAYLLASNLNSNRYRVIVCCLQNLGELGEKLRELGIPVYFFNAESSMHPLHLPRNIIAMFKFIKLLPKETCAFLLAYKQ